MEGNIPLQVTCLILLLHLTEPISAKNAASPLTSKHIISDNNESQAIFTNTEGKTPGIFIPVGEPEPENEGEWSDAEDWPEPGPSWEEAYEKWGLAWEIHIYGFSACFFLVFMYSSYFVVVNLADGLRKKYLSVSLNVMMVLCGFSRSFILALDPYHQGTTVDAPIVLMRILWSISDPCLTAADCLIILSLLETYKLSIAPQRLQRPSTILSIIMIHFTFVFVTDLVVSEFLETKAMLVFCQVFFITWCGTLGVCYFLIGHKLDQLIFMSGIDNEVSQEGRWYIYLIHASGVSNIITSAVYIYSATGVFGVYSNVEFVDAWPWWSLQTALRVTELIAAVLVFTVSAKRAQPATRETNAALSGSDVFDVPAAADSKKRKMSMFSKLHSNRVEKNGASEANAKHRHDGEDPPQPLVQENEIERKNSMFTALGEMSECVRAADVEMSDNSV